MLEGLAGQRAVRKKLMSRSDFTSMIWGDSRPGPAVGRVNRSDAATGAVPDGTGAARR